MTHDWSSLRRETTTFRPPPPQEEGRREQVEEEEVVPVAEVGRKLSPSGSSSSGECGRLGGSGEEVGRSGEVGRRSSGSGGECGQGRSSPDTDSGCDMSVMVTYAREPRWGHLHLHLLTAPGPGPGPAHCTCTCLPHLQGAKT